MARISLALAVVFGLVASVVPASRAPAQETTATINEIRIDQSGADIDEYFELHGPAGASLDGLTYLVIGDGSAAAGSGVIEAVVDLTGHAFGTNGFFLAAEATFTLGTADFTTTLNFENSHNMTHVLVQGFMGMNGDDLDIDNDGVLDSTPWISVVDKVALIVEENPPSGTEYHYGPPSVGPDGAFVPGHVFYCPEPDGWQIGSFGGGDDTPGATNSCEDEPPPPDPAAPVEIYEVQGPGDSSPLVGQRVIIDGIVVGDFQPGDGDHTALGGFHLQEATGDMNPDGSDNTATSNAIFVFDPDAPAVEVGDFVEVTGTVVEFERMTEITEVTDITVIPGGEPLTPTLTALPLPAGSDWEDYEGMLIAFAQQDLYISEFFNYDRSGEIVLTTSRQYQGTQVAEPGDAANAVTTANRLRRITLDDGRTSQNPHPAIHPDGSEFTGDHTFRGGDVLADVTGVLHESRPYSNASIAYRIHPTSSPGYLATNPRPSIPAEVNGQIKVATSNVLNLFTHLDDGDNDICGPTGDQECRGADTAEELNRQLQKLVAGIIALDADVVGIQEIENDIRDDEDVYPNRAHDAVLTLVDELNRAEGEEVWAWVGEANHYNDYPVRNDIIYRVDSVVPVGSPVALEHEAFDKSRPGETEPMGRPPLAQTFRQLVDRGSRQSFTVVVNHFKSKSSDCDVFGDPDTGDGQGECNLTRVAQAEALLDFIDVLEDDSSGVLAIGDFNSYAMEDPVEALERGGLTDLVGERFGNEAYSYVFDGQLGTLDYIFATRSMRNRVADVAVFHSNADEPDILDYDMSFKPAQQHGLWQPTPYRASDHDPIIVGLEFGGPGGRGNGQGPVGPPQGRGPR